VSQGINNIPIYTQWVYVGKKYTHTTHATIMSWLWLLMSHVEKSSWIFFNIIHSFISRMMILLSGSMFLLQCNIWMLMAILCNTQFHLWYLVNVIWFITLNENYEFLMTIPIKSIDIVAIWPQFNINPFNPFLWLVKILYVKIHCRSGDKNER